MKRLANFAGKSYEKCIRCEWWLTGKCSGVRTGRMELNEWSEYMRDMKDLHGLTNADVAEASDTSIKTIEKIMTLKCDQDIRRDTARRIEAAILGTDRATACYREFDGIAPDLELKLRDALRDLERALEINNSTQAELQIVREESKSKIDYLYKEVERARAESDYWRMESERKARIIDKYINKVIQ